MGRRKVEVNINVVDNDDKIIFTGTKEEVAEKLDVSIKTIDSGLYSGIKVKGYYVDRA